MTLHWESNNESTSSGKSMLLFLKWRSSLSSHSSDIDDLLEGLDGVFEDWFDWLHDSESSFHIINLWLHSLDGFHFSGNFNEWLSIIESLEDSGSECFLDVLDGSSLGNGGIGISSGFSSLGEWKFWFEWYKELVLIHGLISFEGFEEFSVVMVVVSGSNSGDEGESNEFHN